jgi:hypothetical protein
LIFAPCPNDNNIIAALLWDSTIHHYWELCYSLS